MDTPPLVTVAVDFDGVVADTVTEYFRMFDLPYTRKDVTQWDWENLEEASIDHFLENLPRVHASLHLMPIDQYCVPSIRGLIDNQDIEVFYLSRNSEKSRPGIESFLKSFGIEAQLELSKNVCKTMWEWDILVDDYPGMANRVQPDRTLIHYPQPYNRTNQRDWSTIYQTIGRAANARRNIT